MQKVFKWIERVLCFFATLGFVMLLIAASGGAALLVLSLALLSLLYFAAGYFQPTSNGKATSAALALSKILSGFTLSLLVIGMLFKFMYWNGAAMLLLVGLLSTTVTAIIILINNRSSQSLSGLLRRSTIWLGLGLVLSFTTSGKLFELFNSNDPVLIKKFNARAAHPGDSRYQVDFRTYQRQQDSLRILNSVRFH
jgi:hypothetical protein